jgi:hypothetical protein
MTLKTFFLASVFSFMSFFSEGLTVEEEETLPSNLPQRLSDPLETASAILDDPPPFSAAIPHSLRAEEEASFRPVIFLSEKNDGALEKLETRVRGIPFSLTISLSKLFKNERIAQAIRGAIGVDDITALMTSCLRCLNKKEVEQGEILNNIAYLTFLGSTFIIKQVVARAIGVDVPSFITILLTPPTTEKFIQMGLINGITCLIGLPVAFSIKVGLGKVIKMGDVIFQENEYTISEEEEEWINIKFRLRPFITGEVKQEIEGEAGDITFQENEYLISEKEDGWLDITYALGK